MSTFFNVAVTGFSLGVCLALGVQGSCQEAAYAIDLTGQPVFSLGGPGTKAVVLWFVSSDCPVSNRTFPEMKRFREEFTGRGVRFWFVYPNADESLKMVQAHQQSYDAGGEALLDVRGKLARLSGARVTPEFAVLVRKGGDWRPVFVGRIDDRWVKLGLERQQATEHFTERVLEEILNGKPVERADGKLVGCGIVSPAAVQALR